MTKQHSYPKYAFLVSQIAKGYKWKIKTQREDHKHKHALRGEDYDEYYNTLFNIVSDSASFYLTIS